MYGLDFLFYLGLFISPQIREALNPQCGGVWRWGFGEEIRDISNHVSGALMIGLVTLQEEEEGDLRLCAHTQKKGPCEDTVRRGCL